MCGPLSPLRAEMIPLEENPSCISDLRMKCRSPLWNRQCLAGETAFGARAVHQSDPISRNDDFLGIKRLCTPGTTQRRISRA